MPLTKLDFTLKRNDTLPSLRLNIFDRGCLGGIERFDLTGATGVTFTMVDTSGNYKVAKKDGLIISSSGGTVQYDWSPEDTDEHGVFRGEFQLSYADGGKLTVPQQGFITVEIFKDITFD